MRIGASSKKAVVSPGTINRTRNPVCIMVLRDSETKHYEGSAFIFPWNPQHVRIEQAARVAVQQAFSGYVIYQNGMGPTAFTISGHFGWQLKTMKADKVFGDGLAAKKTSRSRISAQTLDGQQAWLRLAAFIRGYFEQNQGRIREGKKPLEILWYDQLHEVRHVVVPKGIPTLDHGFDRQGVMPYTLELISQYSDQR